MFSQILSASLAASFPLFFIVKLTPARKLAVIETEERFWNSSFLNRESWIVKRLEASKIRILNESARPKYQIRASRDSFLIELISSIRLLGHQDLDCISNFDLEMKRTF